MGVLFILLLIASIYWAANTPEEVANAKWLMVAVGIMSGLWLVGWMLG
jgi:hypothetical protein